MSNTVQLAGRFKLVAMKADGSGRRDLTDWFDNLITDAGLNSLGAGAGFLTSCSVGSGSSVPAVTDTALGSTIASTVDRQETRTAATQAPWYCAFNERYRFPIGAAAGNLSEIGITHNGVLWSRTLVKDAQGNATTITVLSDEILDVYYELRIYPPETDVVGNFTLNSVQHTATIRASNASSASWAYYFTSSLTGVNQALSADFNNGTNLGPVTGGFGAGTATQSGALSYSDATWSNYIANSMQRQVRYTADLSKLNFSGGIGGGNLSFAFGIYQVKFDPPIPKTNQMILRLDFMISWARRNIV